MVEESNQNEAPETSSTTTPTTEASRPSIADQYRKLSQKRDQADQKLNDYVSQVREAAAAVGVPSVMGEKPDVVTVQPPVPVTHVETVEVAPEQHVAPQHREVQTYRDTMEMPNPPQQQLPYQQQEGHNRTPASQSTAFLGGAMGVRSVPMDTIPNKRGR